MSLEKTSTILDLILLGGPGSGKGTQASLITQKYNLLHISTGELFRGHIKNQTPLGLKAKSFIDAGDLVPDEVTIQMVQDRLSDPEAAQGIVLDGFPRTNQQARSLDSILQSLNRKLSAVIYLDVDDSEIIRRLSSRLICRNCQTPYHKEFSPSLIPNICDKCGGELYQRDDDKPETIKARLNTYHNLTAPLVEYYSEKKLLICVNGAGTLESVSTSIFSAIDQILQTL